MSLIVPISLSLRTFSFSNATFLFENNSSCNVFFASSNKSFENWLHAIFCSSLKKRYKSESLALTELTSVSISGLWYMFKSGTCFCKYAVFFFINVKRIIDINTIFCFSSSTKSFSSSVFLKFLNCSWNTYRCLPKPFFIYSARFKL